MNVERLFAEFDRLSEAPDAVARLRRFILDLAVRGLLVPQQKAFGSAVELVTRSCEQTQVDQPFAIPRSWQWATLAELAHFSAGRTPSRNDPTFWNTGAHRWVSIADMVDGSVLTATRETVSDKAVSSVFGSEPLPPGTILMSFKLTIGKIARLGVAAYHNEAIVNIRPNVAEIDPYLFLVLPQRARARVTKAAIKGATLNRKSLSNITIPLPPLFEQHRIVAKVDDLMAVCDQLEAAQAERERRRHELRGESLARVTAPAEVPWTAPRQDVALFLSDSGRMVTRAEHVAEIRSAVFALAVTGALMKSRKEWGVTKLGDIGSWGSGGTPRAGTSEYYGGSIPWAVIGDLNEGVVTATARTITEIGLKQSSAKMVEPGCLLIAMYGASVGKLGIAGVAMATNQAIAHCKPNQERVSVSYLWLVLRDLRTKLRASAKGGAQPNISQTILRGWTVVFPAPEEQALIVAKVDELMAVCDELEQSLTAVQTGRSRALEALLRDALGNALPTRELELLAAR